jgi:galactokinase
VTGAGFGGSIVALCDPGAVPPGGLVVRAGAAASVVIEDS